MKPHSSTLAIAILSLLGTTQSRMILRLGRIFFRPHSKQWNGGKCNYPYVHKVSISSCLGLK